MNEQLPQWWSSRRVDFVCGFLLGLVFCLVAAVASSQEPISIADVFLFALILGVAGMVFGRRFWRSILDWLGL